MRTKQLPDETSNESIQIIRQAFQSADFVAQHRRADQDFTRERALGFGTVMMLLLQKTVRSVQLHLNEFFDRVGAKAGRGQRFGLESGAA